MGRLTKGHGHRESGQEHPKRRHVKICCEDVGPSVYKGARTGHTANPGSDRAMEAKPMNAAKIVQKGIRENPEVQVVLDIAARARAMEDASPAIDLTPKSDVVTVPNNLQCILCG
ncbi:MAG TPA: hypothetical protein VGS27_27980 [Candidatus Sulfotelmatobacter sp.]|nr:hypothetical protein [Candidatus Sulfotelmatobacter sp.]